MPKPSIALILKQVGAIDRREDKIAFLRQNWSPALGTLLKYAFDDNIKWALPEGAPPYKSSEWPNPSGLYAEARRLYLFVEGQAPEMSAIKREKLFIGMLEFLDKEDAELVIAIKDRTPLPGGVDRKLVEEAYPGLLQPAKENA